LAFLGKDTREKREERPKRERRFQLNITWAFSRSIHKKENRIEWV